MFWCDKRQSLTFSVEGITFSRLKYRKGLLTWSDRRILGSSELQIRRLVLTGEIIIF
jgi:hypothetical protein